MMRYLKNRNLFENINNDVIYKSQSKDAISDIRLSFIDFFDNYSAEIDDEPYLYGYYLNIELPSFEDIRYVNPNKIVNFNSDDFNSHFEVYHEKVNQIKDFYQDLKIAIDRLKDNYTFNFKIYEYRKDYDDESLCLSIIFENFFKN